MNFPWMHTRMTVSAVAVSIPALAFGVLPAAAASANYVERSVTFKITAVEVSGPVVRVRYLLPNDCSWDYQLNTLNPQRSSKIVVHPNGVPKSFGETCSQQPIPVSSIFELNNTITVIEDNAGKVWWTKPGTQALPDNPRPTAQPSTSAKPYYELKLTAVGNRTLKASVVVRGIPSLSHRYTLRCSDGTRHEAASFTTDPVRFAKLKKGALCTASVDFSYGSSNKSKVSSKKIKVR